MKKQIFLNRLIIVLILILIYLSPVGVIFRAAIPFTFAVIETLTEPYTFPCKVMAQKFNRKLY